MKPISRYAGLFAALASTAAAGVFNVVHLGPPDFIRFEIRSGGTSQAFDLAFGGSTGRFILPEKECAILSLPNRKTKDLAIPASSQQNIAVLTMPEDKEIWKMIPGKPTQDKWSLRVVNIGIEPAVIERAGKPLEIAAGATVEIPASDKDDIAVLFKGGDKKSYDGKEPCAIVALLYRKDDGWQVLFIPDR
jgi:hypothetical protein